MLGMCMYVFACFELLHLSYFEFMTVVKILDVIFELQK